MQSVFNPDDASYERDCARCYQCGHEWTSVIFNGASIICLTCGTVNQIAVRYTPAGRLEVSRRLAKEERVAFKLRKARRDALQRRKEKKVAVRLILLGSLSIIPTFIFDLGAFQLPVFLIAMNSVFIGAMSFAYLRYLQF